MIDICFYTPEFYLGIIPILLIGNHYLQNSLYRNFFNQLISIITIVYFYPKGLFFLGIIISSAIIFYHLRYIFKSKLFSYLGIIFPSLILVFFKNSYEIIDYYNVINGTYYSNNLTFELIIFPLVYLKYILLFVSKLNFEGDYNPKITNQIISYIIYLPNMIFGPLHNFKNFTKKSTNQIPIKISKSIFYISLGFTIKIFGADIFFFVAQNINKVNSLNFFQAFFLAYFIFLNVFSSLVSLWFISIGIFYIMGFNLNESIINYKSLMSKINIKSKLVKALLLLIILYVFVIISLFLVSDFKQIMVVAWGILSYPSIFTMYTENYILWALFINYLNLSYAAIFVILSFIFWKYQWINKLSNSTKIFIISIILYSCFLLMNNHSKLFIDIF